MVLAALAGCSNVDVVGGSAPVASVATEKSPVRASIVHRPDADVAAATGADGYPNINVDTARRLGGRVRSTAEQDRLEAELMALGARQRAGADASAPASVIGELEDLGRRSKRDAETAIQSGAPPAP